MRDRLQMFALVGETERIDDGRYVCDFTTGQIKTIDVCFQDLIGFYSSLSSSKSPSSVCYFTDAKAA